MEVARPTYAAPVTPSVWKGVVAIERPATAMAGYPVLCAVMSPRDLRLNGLRAIHCFMQWSQVKQYFKLDDGQCVYVYAEAFASSPESAHLQLYERASLQEFFRTTAIII